jgi:hypothetical protein
VKIVSYNKQYRITLPLDLVKDKGWDAGTELRFVEDEQGRIYLKPIEQPLKPGNKRGGGRS